MGTIELRKRLILEIEQSSNKNLLEEMYNFLSRDNDAELYKLTKAQKEAIAEGREQIKNGQFFTDDQVNDEMEEWLKGKNIRPSVNSPKTKKPESKSSVTTS